MNHHYVLAPRNPELAERATTLVESHRAGHGIRAVATAHRPGDFEHVIALQAPDDAALRSLLTDLQVQMPAQQSQLTSDTATSGSNPVVLTVCGDVPCEQINKLFAFVPSALPACDEIVFLVVQLERSVHDIVDDFTLPPVESHLAGVAISDGNTLLLELGNDDPAQLERDIAQLKAIADVRSIRTVHAAGRKLVRSPHL